MGPTASGKTDLAIKLARKFNGEIVSADSRQIYSEMAIGTASPFLQTQNLKLKTQNHSSKLKTRKKIFILLGIQHHLFHIISPKIKFSVVQYQKLAYRAINDIIKRGKTPFLVGGSPFYIYSVVKGWKFPKMKVSKKLRRNLEKKSVQELFKILKKLSPQRAKAIEPKNKRRIIRAIEIAKTLGRVPQLEKKPLFDCLLFGLKLSGEELKKRIGKRVDVMIKTGLEQEIKELVKKYGWTPVLKETIGYAEWKLLGNFQPGSCRATSKPKTVTKSADRPILLRLKNKIIEQIKINTYKLSKHQMTWFKRDKRIIWIKNQTNVEKLIRKFLKKEGNV